MDDNGSLLLSDVMFKDMPAKAKGVSVTLWRGNASKDAQDLYFQIATMKMFGVELTD